MASISIIRTSNGNGPAAMATVQANRAPASLTFSVDTVSNFNEGGFIATAGTPQNIALASGENLLVLVDPIVFRGHVDSGNIVIDSIVSGYTDTGSSISDVIIVKPTSAWGDEIAEVLSVSLNDDGTLNSDALDQIMATIEGSPVRIAPRITSETSSSGLTPNIDDYGYYRVSAQAEPLPVSNPLGTPNNGDGLLFDLTSNGAARAITWGDAYVARSVYGLTLPTQIPASVNQSLFITFTWNESLSKWVAIL